MKTIILIMCVIATGCCGTKKTDNGPLIKEDTVIQNTLPQNIPACISGLIETFTKEEKQNPPRKIYSYTYRDKQVFYVTAPCCDFFSDLYDSDCKLIGHPDGGFTGKGDGKFPNFEKVRSNEKLMWEDKRK